MRLSDQGGESRAASIDLPQTALEPAACTMVLFSSATLLLCAHELPGD